MKKLLLTAFFSISLFSAERIVTLTPSINEIVFALGEGNNIVGNTTYCDYPEESKTIKKIGGYFNLSLEKVLEVNPTVVIAQDYNKKLLDNLKALNIKTLVYKTDSLSSIKNTIVSLGKYFHKEQKAQILTNKIDESIKSLENIAIDKKILIVIHPSEDLSKNIYVAGNFLYFEDIIKASNNLNAYNSTSKAQPVINMEKLIRLNPDVVVLLGAFLEDKKIEQTKIKNSWYNLPVNASKNKNIYIIAKDYSGIPSHRVVDFINDFKEILEDVRDK